MNPSPDAREFTPEMLRQALSTALVCDALDAEGLTRQSPRVPLRPLTLTDFFDGAFTTIRRNPRATIGVAALVTAGFMVRNTKYAVLIIFIVSAVVSPGTDVVSQCLMAGPMLALYGLSVLVAWMFGKQRSLAS